ncbi:MAG TPA: carboxypeptidase regulatory-like domain-containing protein, partial [Bacteroidales bacterium]|nr:carboxypeptidase regulatory-like domain-containing protein [Bacteroidales bacterium]
MKLLPLLVTLVLLVNMLMFSNAQQPPAGSPQGIDRNIGVLHGKVIDSLSSLPLEYSNIILFRKADSSMVNGTITGKDGTFRIEKIPVGRYYAIIRFIGFEDYLIPELMFTFRNPEIALGSIIIQPTATALRGIEITTERDMMISNLDKRVINVDKDLTGVGGTAVDIMQNIPSVTVDVEGNVKLRGSSNVLLLIDGRPTGLEGINSADILQQIPANTIESIEVITNPSVRHDPDGNTGIINIVLKRRSLEGLSAMVSLNAGNGGRYNGNINVNM